MVDGNQEKTSKKTGKNPATLKKNPAKYWQRTIFSKSVQTFNYSFKSSYIISEVWPTVVITFTLDMPVSHDVLLYNFANH